MTHRFSQVMFTPTVKGVQEALGSRGAYERFEEPGLSARDRLGEGEAAFIAQRDSFYMATVSETGWPYVQHRGGPPGFLKVLDDRTIGFADYSGNRQYVSVGNLTVDDRVALILIDYPNRRRLKIIGRARLVDHDSEPDTIRRLRDRDYDARIERAMVIAVEGFDWNCPQHITPRFTQAEVARSVAPLIARLQALEAERDRTDSGAPETSGAGRVLGRGSLELVVSAVRQLTPRVRGYELRAAGGGDLPPASAGSHLAVPVRLDDGRDEIRTYSISSDPARRDAWEIAVLSESHGRGGSRAVHRDYGLGLRLRCGPPTNAFPLHDDQRPAVLVAGGIGVTPILAMALALKAGGRAVRLHYAARSPVEAAYRRELGAALGRDVTFYFGKGAGGRLDAEAVLAAAPPDAVVYVCGPASLIEAVRAAAAARGWPGERIRFERFAPAVTFTDDRAFDLVLARSGERVHVEAGESALSALERAGRPMVSNCRTGTCATCVVKVTAGDPDHRDEVLSAQDRAAGVFTTCVSRALGTELTIDL